MTRTRKLALIAILSAISFSLMFFQVPLLPAADFLQIDFSILPILVGLVLLDLKSSLAILLIRSVIKLLLNSQGVQTYIGLPMNILALTLFILCFAWFWKERRTGLAYIEASIAGTLALTLGMLAANYFYALPMYAAFANFDIAQIIGVSHYLFAMVLPFNLLQGILFSIVFSIVYKALSPLLKQYET